MKVVYLESDKPVRVDILPQAPAAADARVDAEWERKRAINPRLFDGPVLSVLGISGNVITCQIDSYKRLVVQPEIETGVRMLSVTGVLIATDPAGRDRVLLGRRSHKTRMYGGMWQNCPAGGLDPVAGATQMNEADLAAELLREVKEEAGLEPATSTPPRPVAVIYDEVARSHDLIVPVELGPVAELSTTRGWEYDELKWLDIGCVGDFEEEESGKIMAITREIFRVMDWLPDEATAQYNGGRAVLEQGDVDQAIFKLLQSFAIQPHGATARKLADAFERRGDIPSEDSWRRRAYEVQPNSDVIAVQYARSLVRNGNTSAAATVLQGVLKRNATYGPAKELLAALTS